MKNRTYKNYEDRNVSAFTVFAKAADNTLWANEDFSKGLDLAEFAEAYKNGSLLIDNNGTELKAVAFNGTTVSTIGQSGLVTWTPTEALKATAVSAEVQSKVMWDYTVADLQEDDVVIADSAITGTLKYIDTGSLADVWGPGYFLALKFTASALATSVKVGLDPTVGSGLVEIIGDPDMDGAFKVTSKDRQKFKVVTTDGDETITETFDLSGLTLTPANTETSESTETEESNESTSSNESSGSESQSEVQTGEENNDESSNLEIPDTNENSGQE